MAQILVYMTAPNQDVALKIGQALLENRLAACVNIMPAAQSMYWWDGAIQRQTETVFLAKTEDSLFERLRTCVLGLHPYEVPCIVALAVDQGHEPFLSWISEQTQTLSEKGAQNELTGQIKRS